LKKLVVPYFGFILALIALAGNVLAAEVIPPAPARYFNDYAGVVSKGVGEALNGKLEQLEKADSTQVVVAIFKKMESDSSVEDYTVRVAQKWGVGQKGKSNGAILFVFIEDRQMYLQAGYGLEGAIPDITAKDITENRIKPHFRTGNFDAGLTAGVDSIIQAVRGEYQGTGRTVAQGRGGGNNRVGLVIFAMIMFFMIMGMTRRRRRGHLYRGTGRRGWGGPIWTGGGSGWGGGSSGWGGGGWGGGGGFSGGGGGFGGGGAGSKW
jgi:uncharacterized protein